MSQNPRKVLIDLLAAEGVEILDNPRRVRGFLKDLLVGRPKEGFWLNTAVQNGIVAELRQSSQFVANDFLIPNLSGKLRDQSGFSSAAATWTVESWAIALGLIGAVEGATDVQAPVEPDVSGPVIVGPPGIGTHATIMEALESVDPGTRIRIAPGVYSEAIAITKDVDLIGSDPPGSVVISAPDAAMVRWNAENGLLRNLTFQNQSEENRGLVIETGNPHVELCQFLGDGLGIDIHGGSNPTITGCEFANALCGIALYGNAAGLIDSNQFSTRNRVAILVRNSAHPKIRANRVLGGGIMYVHVSSGECLENEIEDSESDGIFVTDQADPTVKKNRIRGSLSSGVRVDCEARGTFSENIISACDHAGIRIGGSAMPQFNQDTVVDCKGPGIWVHGTSRSQWTSCRSERNGKSGLLVGEAAAPRTFLCSFIANEDAGAFFYGEARGELRSNFFESNQRSGVAIRDAANPTLLYDSIRGNTDAGVMVYAGGKGVITHALIEENVGAGIVVVANGAPLVQSCRIQNNGGVGIQLDQTASGSIIECEIKDNIDGPWSILPGATTRREGNRER